MKRKFIYKKTFNTKEEPKFIPNTWSQIIRKDK